MTAVATGTVKAPGIATITDTLSGGNQQKTVVARELARDSEESEQ